MSSDNTSKIDTPPDLERRKFLNTAAAVGVAGTFLSAGLVGCKKEGASTTGGATAPAVAGGAHEVAPGQLDSYYGLWSGGHTGDVRVLGLPSGREIHRIPVFNPDALVGWGITNESKAVMGTKADGSLKYHVADTHHVHGSYKDGTYDGKYAWVNDKINCRIARMRLDTFVCDKITEIPIPCTVQLRGCRNHGSALAGGDSRQL